MNDIILEEKIRKNSKSNNTFRFEIFDSVDSTNTVAKDFALKGNNEGLVVIASHQTAGRGRMGRSFLSPDNTGIYMSILLRPNINPKDTVLITTAAAAAVSKAIENLFSIKTEIKWVNDIILNSKKVCGILTEGAINPETNLFDYAILGIGINLYKPKDDFDESIKDIAGYILENQEPYTKASLICEILNNFWEYYEILDKKQYYEYYKSRCLVLGKDINIISNSQIIGTATVLDLEKDFSLKVRTADGEEKLLSSGEVSIRKI